MDAKLTDEQYERLRNLCLNQREHNIEFRTRMQAEFGPDCFGLALDIAYHRWKLSHLQ